MIGSCFSEEKEFVAFETLCIHDSKEKNEQPLLKQEEGEHKIDVSSTNVERDDETYLLLKSSFANPSPDNFIVKSIRYANYNLESMIDRYPNLRGSLTVKSELRNFSKFRMILENKNW
ncbi:hypothetical protein H5410_023291 [Solanum commersonii]|uniref:Uncharacterized protein n=1 Tax=Solanum commersonii TaxID=4109 RepID=A0A9J5ZH56_SOLCO|nr:hypothetical protein H5410_023291 [Solanum commersonii]